MLAACAERQSSPWRTAVDAFALARVAASGGATRSELLRDLASYFSHKLTPSEFRAEIDAALEALDLDGFAVSQRGRLTLTPPGRNRATELLATTALTAEWADIRDQSLTALALGRPDLPLTRKKTLARPDGLRMAVIQRAFDLRLRRTPTPARVRAALAGVALKRAIAGDATISVRTDGGIDAATGRKLAAQLSRRPQSFANDTQLIAALAAEVIGAPQPDIGTLRLVLFRQFVTALGTDALTEPGADVPAPLKMSSPALSGSAAADAEAEPISDVEAFADRVLTAGNACAQGWEGSRKALIGDLFDALAERHPDSQLALNDFKALLIEAHRHGHITLASADLKSADDRDALTRSETIYKNTVWHFLRLDT